SAECCRCDLTAHIDVNQFPCLHSTQSLFLRWLAMLFSCQAISTNPQTRIPPDFHSFREIFHFPDIPLTHVCQSAMPNCHILHMNRPCCYSHRLRPRNGESEQFSITNCLRQNFRIFYNPSPDAGFHRNFESEVIEDCRREEIRLHVWCIHHIVENNVGAFVARFD